MSAKKNLDLILLHDAFTRFANAVKRAAETRFPSEPVSFWHRRVLRTLRDDGPMTVAELARRRVVTRQAARAAVQQIDAATEHLCWRRNPAHRGAPLLSLSQKGRDYINSHDAKVVEFLWEILGDFFDEGVYDTEGCLAMIHGARARFEDWIFVHDPPVGGETDFQDL